MKEIMDRFIEWVNKHGGPTPVAIAIGKSPQSFYNYTNRGSKPNMEIFALLANHYPDFDTDFILTGRGKSGHDIEDKLKALESKYQILQSMYEEVSAQKKNLMPGKFRGAILLSPDTRDRNMRKVQFNDRKIDEKLRRNKSRSVSARVPGALIVSELKELLSRPL